MSSSRQVRVTIEGSVTPSVILPRGQRRTVMLTDRIQRLIDRGFVVVISREEVTPTSHKKGHGKAATEAVSPATAPDKTPPTNG